MNDGVVQRVEPGRVSSGVLELLAVDAWAAMLLFAAVAKLWACDPGAATVTRLLERVLPGASCEALICAETVLGVALLFGERALARRLALASGALCLVGNVALWIVEGNVDCGCLGMRGATHGVMTTVSAVLVVLLAFARDGRVASLRLQRGVAGSALLLAAGLGALSRPAASTMAWWSSVEHVVSDGDVVLFGASSCDVCRSVARDGRLRIEGREVALDAVVLVHADGDASIGAAAAFKASVQVSDVAWWDAVGVSAPSAYVVRGGRARWVEVESTAK